MNSVTEVQNRKSTVRSDLAISRPTPFRPTFKPMRKFNVSNPFDLYYNPNPSERNGVRRLFLQAISLDAQLLVACSKGK
jgi:hypothetical protein